MTEGWLQVLDVLCRKTTWLLVVSVTESGIANEDGAGAVVDAIVHSDGTWRGQKGYPACCQVH